MSLVSNCKPWKPSAVTALHSSTPTTKARSMRPLRIIVSAWINAFALAVHAVLIV
jgi:hypothetical protein